MTGGRDWWTVLCQTAEKRVGLFFLLSKLYIALNRLKILQFYLLIYSKLSELNADLTLNHYDEKMTGINRFI